MASSAQPIIHHNIDNSNNTDINLANRNTATIPTTAANSITNSIEVITLRLRICFISITFPFRHSFLIILSVRHSVITVSSLSAHRSSEHLSYFIPFKNEGVRVGFYEIYQTIGRGNFAVVKLAKHRITKTQVDFSLED